MIAAIACVFIAAPIASSAQRYGQDPDRSRYNHNDYRYNRDDFKDWVNSVQRESKSFRDYFEHNFRAFGHAQQRWDRSGDLHPEHEGRNGNMTLLDAIQNTDEDLERLRAEVKYHDRSRYARDLMNEIVDHSRDVDARIGRVADTYRYNDDRAWRYDRNSELYRRWQDLRADIRDLDRGLNYRGR
ncbi:MAG: hypothetical protein ACHQ50_06875 [Fimbriimonadales bacterium]